MHDTLSLLTAWLPQQRWYTPTGRAPRLRLLADRALSSDDPRARVSDLVLVDDAATRPIVYHVPIVERSAAPSAGARGLIGASRNGYLIDGPHDRAFTRALLAHVAPHTEPTEGNVLRGEQSNTSIIFEPEAAPPIICKVYRQLSAGLNPDVELQTALAAAGSPYVAGVVGTLDGRWDDPADPTHETDGTLAFAQEFLPDVEDAWRVALRSAAAGEDFTAAADALGRATAAVHLTLASQFPGPPADDYRRAAIAETWRRRLEIAASEAPALAPHRDAIRARYAAAATTAWPQMQRIHGDFHLGQVLHVPGRGWVLLDFEGEPLRPMTERRLPDLAVRDLAGMLRSFDYVAGSLALAAPHGASGTPGTDGESTQSTESVIEWARAARSAFLTGYREVAGSDPSGPLLDAFELEKAVYETIYEARHRPGWLAIPLAAIERLIAR